MLPRCCHRHFHRLLLRQVRDAVFDRTLVPFSLPRLLLGWMPHIMVPEATKNDGDRKEREYNRWHDALLFCFCRLLNTRLAHNKQATVDENTSLFIRDVLAIEEHSLSFL